MPQMTKREVLFPVGIENVEYMGALLDGLEGKDHYWEALAPILEILSLYGNGKMPYGQYANYDDMLDVIENIEGVRMLAELLKRKMIEHRSKWDAENERQKLARGDA